MLGEAGRIGKEVKYNNLLVDFDDLSLGGCGLPDLELDLRRELGKVFEGVDLVGVREVVRNCDAWEKVGGLCGV